MGILDWIEEKARKKMRFSHVKILYQNIFASAFLVEERGVSSEDTLKSCEEIQDRTRDFALEMPEDDMLNDASSEVLFADNRALKKIYATLGESTDFVERFQPTAGWKGFSDDDWKAVVSGLK